MKMLVVGRWRVRVGSRWLVTMALGTILLVAVTGAAAAAVESRTVPTYWRGLWWAVSLVTTVGFIGEPPETIAGAALSAALMIFGFLLLATVSASLAALFVREEELPREEREDSAAQAVLASLHAIEHRLALLEGAIRSSPEDGVDAATTAGSSNGEETERGDFSLEPPA